MFPLRSARQGSGFNDSEPPEAYPRAILDFTQGRHDEAMNDHLRSVFDTFLPTLEHGGVCYWVYGGLSIAASCGRFVRENEDVDAFVKEADFDRAKQLLENACRTQHCPVPRAETQKWRRKLIIKSNKGRSLLTVVNVQVNEDAVMHLYGRSVKRYPLDFLSAIPRNIEGFRFFTPDDEHIKGMFLDYIRLRSGRPLPRPRRCSTGSSAPPASWS
jgi:hypothetical protein